MIYLDTSVVLAHLLAEQRHPPDEMWSEPLVSSRLLVYETWTRLHALKLARTHADAAAQLLAGVGQVDMDPTVLARAKESFPIPVRTLDALHLATIDFLRSQGQKIELASYDDRLNRVAGLMGWPVWSRL